MPYNSRQKRRKRRPQSLFFLFLFKNGSVTPLNGLGVLLEVETPEFVLWYGRGKCICLAFSIYLLEQPLLYVHFNYFKTYLFYLEYFLWLVLLIYIWVLILVLVLLFYGYSAMLLLFLFYFIMHVIGYLVLIF